LDPSLLAAFGFQMPSPAYLVAIFLFSILGMAAWIHGRKGAHPRTRWLGLAMMLYPYVISSTLWLWIIGLALCVAIWVDLSGRWPSRGAP
jgi:hypothetical protein